MIDAQLLIIAGIILIIISIALGFGGHIGVAISNIKHEWRGHGK
jgi:hypothetical protein